jgi:DNA-binding MarR family transcriptional regulator
MNTTPEPTAEQCAQDVLDVAPLIMRAIRADMRAHRHAGFSVPQFRMLAFLNRNEGASLSGLAEFIGLTLPSASTMVDTLVARKLSRCG